MPWHITTLFIVAVLNAVFSLILIRGSRTRVNNIFSVFVLSASAWSVGIGLFLGTGSLKVALYAADFYYVAAALIPILFLHFSLLFLREKDNPISIFTMTVLYVPIVTFIVAVVVDPHIILSSISLNLGMKDVILNPVPYSLYGFIFASYVVAAFLVLTRKLHNTRELDRRLQLNFIILGTVVPYILGMIFNLILPWLGNYRQIWLGPVFSLMMVASIGYAIAKHHLFNLKIIATEVAVVALWIFVLIRTILSDTLSDQLLNGGLLISLIVIGVLLIRSVIKEVKTRERVEQLANELGVANDRLTQLDRQKSEFLSIASHQLRSPLTAIKGYSSMMLEGSFGHLTDKLKEAVERVFLSSERLVIIIEDFLNVSRIEQGRMQYEFSTVDLDKLVQEAVAELTPGVVKAGLTIEYQKVGEGPFFTTADYGKVRQMVVNIIDNATKYTPKGGIIVTLEAENKVVRINIKDTGIGIPADVLPTLFEKFTRAKGAGLVNTQGTGLGLYVVKELMKAHKGRVWVESPGAGLGSTFHLEFVAQ